MFDINFFKNTYQYKKDLLLGNLKDNSVETIFSEFEKYRSRVPYALNVETTNNCIMSCVMCPRTSLMTREIKGIGDEFFSIIINQMNPHSEEDINSFLIKNVRNKDTYKEHEN